MTSDSRLREIVGRDEILVNSFHHQAVDTLAPGLAVTALAPDGIIEAVELPRDNPWWVIGIQWHPEDLAETAEPWDKALFATFARAVRETPAYCDS
jgi:putative glutamine amidotransferase